MDIDATNPLLADATTLDNAISAAVAKYQTDRPRLVTADVTGNGTPYYVLVGTGALLASWSDQFSVIERIEYPAEAVGADYVPTYLSRQDDWHEEYRDASKTYLRLRTVSPSASETLRITYTAPHTHTSVTDTVPAADLEALYDLAAHYACLELGTKMAGSSDSVISADSVNYRDSQLRYRQQAQEWLASYNRRMGIAAGEAGGSGGGKPGASAVADWDRGLQNGRMPFLTHHPRFR
jgi:hypothetical protein